MMSDSVSDVRTGSSEPAPMIPAWRSGASWLRFLLPAVLGLVADLTTKAWAFPDGVPAIHRMVGRYPVEDGYIQPLIPNVLGMTTTVNEGAVFGYFQGWVWVFLIFSIFATALITWVFVSSKRDQWVVHLSLGLITAGALGNMYDRMVYHAVRDMFRFYVSWYAYIFNIADVLLCIGVPLLLARWMFVKDSPFPKKA